MPAIAPTDNPVVGFVVVVLAAAVEDADNDMLMDLDISVDCTKKILKVSFSLFSSNLAMIVKVG